MRIQLIWEWRRIHMNTKIGNAKPMKYKIFSHLFGTPDYSFVFRQEALILELWFEVFGWHLSIEPFGFLALVIDHVVLSYPFHLPLLGMAELTVCRGCSPISRVVQHTSNNADWSIPLAGSCLELVVSHYEGCAVPVNFNEPTSFCPVICIP
uniref:Uncharacterized protein n=1 Tax=Rhizophora mucronata TaxID=61149 RepID=A0A2P2N135_RHIMU